MSSLRAFRWRLEGMREGYIRKDSVNTRLHGKFDSGVGKGVVLALLLDPLCLFRGHLKCWCTMKERGKEQTTGRLSGGGHIWL